MFDTTKSMPFLKRLFSAHKEQPNNRSVNLRLQGPRVTLRAATPTDWQKWKTLREESRAFLTPWEPTWPLDALTYDYFCRNLRRQWKEWREGTAYAFLICANNRAETGIESNEILGGLALTEIQKGIAQRATIGYWMGKPYAGKGFMAEAASLALAFAFDELHLNRVEASCLPHNEPSKRLLEKMGFTLEGKARQYLRINGQWQDHLLWALTASDRNNKA